MSVDRRPDGTYRARYRDAAHREHSKHFRRIRDAKDWEAEQRASLKNGSWVDPDRAKITVSLLGETWLAEKRRLKPSSYTDYESIFRVHVQPRWGNVRVDQVSYAETSAWLSQLSELGLSPIRSNRALLVLSQILNLAVEDQRLTRNLTKRVKRHRSVRKVPRYITHDQLADLADACGGAGEQYRLLVLLLGTMGLRWGEARAVRWNRVDLEARRLEVVDNLPGNCRESDVVLPKSHRTRTVPVPGFLADQLTVFLAGRARDDLVFTNRAGHALNTSNFRRSVFGPAVMRLDLGPFTPHDLRATAASIAVSAGANVKAVQQMLGHKSAAMTLDLYASLFVDDLDEVAERISSRHLAATEAISETANIAKIIHFPQRRVAD